MKPVSDIPVEQLKGMRYLLTDIDDTVTENGLLPAASLAAIERLDRAGIAVIPVTGRPAGWCDHIARMWSVRGVVGENGAFYFSYDRQKRTMRQVFAKSADDREKDKIRLNQIKRQVLERIPGAGVSSDQEYRVADLAIDFCEDVASLSQEEVQKIVQIFEDCGATAKVSSIHVNGWFGEYDKLSMTKRCLNDLFGVNIKRDNEKIVFIGDSPNDSPMFSYFKNSVGVANVADFDLPAPPSWISNNRSSGGFIEFAALLLKAHGC